MWSTGLLIRVSGGEALIGLPPLVHFPGFEEPSEEEVTTLSLEKKLFVLRQTWNFPLKAHKIAPMLKRTHLICDALVSATIGPFCLVNVYPAHSCNYPLHLRPWKHWRRTGDRSAPSSSPSGQSPWCSAWSASSQSPNSWWAEARLKGRWRNPHLHRCGSLRRSGCGKTRTTSSALST